MSNRPPSPSPRPLAAAVPRWRLAAGALLYCGAALRLAEILR